MAPGRRTPRGAIEPAPPQLTIDGDEKPSRRPGPPLNGTQRLIVGKLREQGQIRSVEAGRILHEARGTRCARYGGERAGSLRDGSLGCCAYASADGLEALKRLEKRGLVKRGGHVGVWVAA